MMTKEAALLSVDPIDNCENLVFAVPVNRSNTILLLFLLLLTARDFTGTTAGGTDSSSASAVVSASVCPWLLRHYYFSTVRTV